MNHVATKVEGVLQKYTGGPSARFGCFAGYGNVFHVCPLAHEIIGGAEDGRVFLPDASLNLLVLNEIFDRVTNSQLQIEGIMSCLVVQGFVDDEFCTLKFYVNPPERRLVKHDRINSGSGRMTPPG